MDDTGTPGGGPPPQAAGSGEDSPDTERPPVPDRLRGAEAAKTHLTLAVGLAVCVAAFWFELGRALGGNSLSWAYVFEWPLFAVFAVYMWWNVLHGGRPGRHRRAPKADRPVDPRYAGMLDAWQNHQRELQAAQAEAEGRPPPTRPAAGSDGPVGDASAG